LGTGASWRGGETSQNRSSRNPLSEFLIFGVKSGLVGLHRRGAGGFKGGDDGCQIRKHRLGSVSER